MSYDISLTDPCTHEVLCMDEPHHMKGGNYVVGGTDEMWLNVTYNYSRWYYKVFPDDKGIRAIYGLSGAESIPILRKAISDLEAMTEDISAKERRQCETQECTGYWLPTRVNAIKPLYSLLAFAQMRPDGVWDGD